MSETIDAIFEDRQRAALQLGLDDFLVQAEASLPTGPAWSRAPASVRRALLRGFLGNHARVWARMRDLLEESDPRTCYETVTDWERDCGLPDPCVGELAPDIEGRRRDIVAKRQMGAITTPQQFIDLCAVLGYEVTVTEFRPFRTWSDCNAFLNTEAVGWTHSWLVTVQGEPLITVMRCNSPCDSFLRNWGYSSLECTLLAIKPAHTLLMFAYVIPPPLPP